GTRVWRTAAERIAARVPACRLRHGCRRRRRRTSSRCRYRALQRRSVWSKHIADLVEGAGHQEALVLVDLGERLPVQRCFASVAGLLATTFTPGPLPEYREAPAAVAHDADRLFAELLPQRVRDGLRLFVGVLVLHVLVHDGLRLYRREGLLHQRDDGQGR